MGDKTGSEHQDRSLFLVQIRYLEEELERYQLAYEELEKHNKELLSRYHKLEKEKRDQTEPLKRLVAAKEKAMDELHEQLETRLVASKRDRVSLRRDHGQRQQELQEKKKQLQTKIGTQAAALEENEKRMAELRRRVSEARNEEERRSQRKREYEADIQRQKRNCELNCEQSLRGFQDYSEHAENADASRRLERWRAWRAEQAEVLAFLLEERHTLTEEVGALRSRQAHVRAAGRRLMTTLSRLSRLRNVNEKDAKLLGKKLQELKEDKENLMEEQEAALAETQALGRRVGRAAEERRQKASDVERLQEELERETMRRRDLEAVREEAVVILRHILTSPGDMAEWKIWRLVEILDRVAPQGTGPTSSNSCKKARGGQNLHTSDPNSPRNEKPSGSVDPSVSTPLPSDSWTGTGSTGP